MKQPRNSSLAGLMVVFMLTLSSARLIADEWVVPADRKAEAAPFRFTEETREKGAALFAKTCQSCHGVPTKDNWIKLQPPPGDPASEKFRKDSDGDLFYKISTGRGTMPQFMNVLSEEDRWDVISYIRSFHPGYVQPSPELALAAAKGGRSIIVMKADSSHRMILFTVTNKKGNVVAPASNAGILVFVRRYFGMLQVGTTRTNASGNASFAFADSIPGDERGNLVVTVRLNETSGYGSAERVDTLAVREALPLGQPDRTEGDVERQGQSAGLARPHLLSGGGRGLCHAVLYFLPDQKDL